MFSYAIWTFPFVFSLVALSTKSWMVFPILARRISLSCSLFMGDAVEGVEDDENDDLDEDAPIRMDDETVARGCLSGDAWWKQTSKDWTLES